MISTYSIPRLCTFMAAIAVLLCLQLNAQELHKYHTYAKLTSTLKQIANKHSNLVDVKTLAKTRQGRDIWMATVSDKKLGEINKKPALLIVANLEGNQVIGSELVLGTLAKLVQNASQSDTIRQLFAKTTMYIVPRLNPDGAEKMFAKPLWESATNTTPIDDDSDGFIDEDPPDDLNGDGFITTMRVKEPGGEYISHPKDDRLLKKADPAKNEIGVYKIYVEGKDNDGDKTINEDPIGGVDLNRNFPFGYNNFAPGTGVHQVSEIESRALADFVAVHENITAILTFGTNDNLINPPKQKSSAKGPDAQSASVETQRYQREPPTQVDAKDIYLYTFLSEKYKKLTGLKSLPKQAKASGTFSDYGYFDWGILSLTSSGWAIPEPLKEEADTTAAKEDSNTLKLEDQAKPKQPKSKEANSEKLRKAMDTAKAEKDEQQDELNLLKWFDRDSLNRFVKWQSIRHPDFPDRQVEVGGFKPYAETNPPPELIDSLVDKHSQFITELLKLFPKVEIESFKIEEKTADVAQIKAVVRNTGFLPTLTQLGSRMRLNRPTKVELKLNNQELLSGNRINFIKRLDGLGGNATFIWTVKGRGEITLSVDSPKGDQVSKSIQL
jgi:hypothetical protein